jgi:predicted amidohydrolase
MDPLLGDPDRNAAQICASLSTAADEDAGLIVFPEAALTGYLFADLDEARAGAVHPSSAPFARIREACADLDVWCVFGAIEASSSAKIFNSAFLLSPAGEIGRYRKIHTLCLGVDRFTTAGEDGFRVWKTPFGRIGLNICYDGSFPESARVLKLLGAELIVLPTNWPDIELTTELVRIRARENHLWYLAVNRVGTERGITFPGGSVAAGPRGQRLAEAGGEPGRFIVEMNLAVASRNRVVQGSGEYEFDYVADRRPDLYQRLVEPPQGEPTGSRGAAGGVTD